MRTRKDAYVMIDIEASGPRLAHHDLIQFGAVAVWGERLEQREAFTQFDAGPGLPRGMLAPQFGANPEPSAIAVTGLDWKVIKAHGEAPAAWAARFHGWIAALRAKPGVDLAVIVAHGITMDWSFTRAVYDAHRTDWPCHYSGLDFKSWWGGHRGKEFLDSSMTDMREVFGTGENPKKHDAQADAEYQLDFMLKAFARAGIVA